MTEDIIRHLAQQKDVNAMLALKKHALRHDDNLLLQYVEEVAKARLLELKLEMDLWENCAAVSLRGTGSAIILRQIGPNKIQVIKEVRAMTGLSLKEAKHLVDHTPAIVVEHVHIAGQAEAALDLLARAGAIADWDTPSTVESRYGITLYRGDAVETLLLDRLPGYRS